MSSRIALFCGLLALPIVFAGSFAFSRRIQTVRWSDPAAWTGHVPRSGEDVVIPLGETVVLDEDPPPLRRLKVEGTLQFAERNLTLSAADITVSGTLQIGTEAHPFEHHAVLELTGRRPDSSQSAPSNKALMVDGGTLELHGARIDKTWTRLSRNADPGTKTVLVSDVTGWLPGSHIVIASTDFDSHQSEERVVTSVTGNLVSLDKPLRYLHWGSVTDGVPEQAEVGLLTRNVVIRGDTQSNQNGYGGQVIILKRSRARISDIELTRMGQMGRMGCYPIHFHLVGDASGSRVVGCAIHDCFNRAVTIHGTNGLTVANNVCDGTYGHAFFLEDGIEENNTLSGNLALGIRRPPAAQSILATDQIPAAFWITNPANTITGNVAAGSEGQGFWMALPKHPSGPSRTAQTDHTVWPRRLPLRKFDLNVSHSNDRDGLNVDGPHNPPGETDAPTYDPPAPSGETTGTPIRVGAAFTRFTSYKNRRHGVWMRGSHLLLTNSLLADNSIGVTLAGSESAVTHSRFVGETGNIGTTTAGDPHGDNGRSLPKPMEAHFPIRGFEFYDGLVCAQDVAFANFRPSPIREAGALSYLRYSPFFVDPRNWIAGAEFDDSNRVYLDKMSNEGAAAYGGDGYRSAVFMDRDGSVTGTPGASVTVRNALLADPRAKLHPDWNAYVTPASLGRLFIDTQEQIAKTHAPVRIARLENPLKAGSRDAVALWGAPASGPKTSFQSTVITNTAYRVSFTNGLPEKLRLTLRHRNPGDYIDLSLPSDGVVALYSAGHMSKPLLPEGSEQAFDSAKQSAYMALHGRIIVRLIVPPGKTLESLTIERTGAHTAGSLGSSYLSRIAARSLRCQTRT